MSLHAHKSLAQSAKVYDHLYRYWYAASADFYEHRPVVFEPVHAHKSLAQCAKVYNFPYHDRYAASAVSHDSGCRSTSLRGIVSKIHTVSNSDIPMSITVTDSI